MVLGTSLACTSTVQERAYQHIETVNADYVSSNEARLYGKLKDLGDSSMVYYGFKVGITRECSDFDIGPTATTYEASFWLIASNLQPNTKYYYKAYAEFPVAVYYGKVLEFTTKP
jgi:hypothetical protein